MLPQQGIMSLTKPDAQADRAVGQVLNSTTQMLSKLDNKTLGLLLQLTQYLKAHKSKYKELMANLEAKGSLPPGVFPDHYDPKFLSVFAMSVSRAQQGGMAAGGIASIAQTMKDQGRGKDTMLAHISPSEARLLEERGGVNTINPVTGLPEFGIFDDIGNALSGVGKAVGSVLKPVGDLIGGVLSSPLGLAATAAAAYYFLGPGAAVVPSVAEAAIPGEAAAIGTAAHLTPAAIESGIGSAGYGTNASAAASGLFNPETIGSGAAIGAPSTSDKLLTANLLKNTRVSAGEEDSGSDPNALIKMLMMYEMMGSKQNQPANAPLPELTEATSSLPYDAPKKKMSSFISQPTQQAAGGGLMTKHLGIGGLSARRSQTDYAKNYLPGSGYRPGQGGITYFTPMEYTGGDTTTSTDTTGGSSSSATDELLRQTLGRTGGGGGGMDAESRAAMLAETAKRMDEWEARDPEGYKHRNDWIGNLFNGSLLVQLAKLAAQGIDTVKQTWADNRLKALGIDPKIVLANQNELAGMSMEKALQSVGQNTTPSFTERSPEQMAGISMQRALESLGQNTTPLSSVDSGGYADSARYAGSQNDVIKQLIADSNAAANASQNAEVAPSVGYTFQPNAVQDALANSRMPAVGFGLPANAADRYLYANEAQEKEGRTPRLVPPRYEGIVSAANLGSQFPGPNATTPASEAVGSYPAGSEARIAADVNAGKITNGSVIGVDGKNYTVSVDQGAGGMGAPRISLTPTGAQTNTNITPFSLPAREATTPEAQAATIARILAEMGSEQSSTPTTDPYANVDYRTPAIEAEKAEKAEQARIAAAEEKAYAERMAAKPVDAVDTTYTREAFDTIKENRDRLEKQYLAGVDAFGDPLTQSYMDGLKAALADNNKSLAEANAKGFLSPEASRDAYNREKENLLAQNKEGFPDTPEGDAKAHVIIDRVNAVMDRINKLDSPLADRFAPEMTTTGATQAYRENTANAFNSLKPGSLLYAPADYSNQFLTPEQYDKLRDPTDPITGQYRTPYANYPEEPTPESESEKLDQMVQALLSMEPIQLGDPIQLAALGDYNLGEDGSDTIGNYSMAAPKEAVDNSGLLSTAAIQQAYPGAFDQSPLSSLAPTSYSYFGGQGGNSILGGYGGLGSAWQGVVDSGGNPVLTSQGAAERAFLSSPEGIAAANEKAYQNYSPPQDPAQRQGQGNNRDGGDGGDGGNAASNAAAQTRANDNSATSGGWFGGGPSDARGGYLQNGRFDQRMAHGGIANLQYNLGSYSDGGRLLKGPGDGVSDSIPATIGQGQPARLADGEFVIPARIVSELGNGSTDAGAKRLYEMMDRIQKVRRKTKNVAANTKAAKYLPA